MMILPEQNAPRGKMLLPMRRARWRSPSQRATTFGIENETLWRLDARLQDGYLFWRGWFDDREDADAFLWSLASGSLRHERELWRLPQPLRGNAAWHDRFDPPQHRGEWSPDLAEVPLIYQLDTVSFLTSPTGSNQTFNVPTDWNNAKNSGKTIGGGGGCDGGSPGNLGPGAGGGAFSRSDNITLTPGGTATYQVGPGGTNSTSFGTATPGGDSWFNGTTLAGSSVGAKGGGAPTNNGGLDGGPGAPGGDASAGVGSALRYSGGNGAQGLSGTYSGGGGGAAGPDGSPGTGQNASGATGGGGDAGLGGAGGGQVAGVGQDGGAGTEFNASHGAGGGAGGNTTAGSVGHNGGLYGGAASGARLNGGAGGLGAQGIAVVSYVPLPLIFIDASSALVAIARSRRNRAVPS